MPSFKPPEPFSFAYPSTWSDWQKKFKRFRIATELDKKAELVQISQLICAMGDDAEKIYESFGLTEDANLTFDQVVMKFNNYFTLKRNIVHERARFYERCQQPGETIDTYIRSLYELAAVAEVPSKEEAIRGKLIIGVLSKELSEKLEQAISQARLYEQVKAQMNEQKGATANVDAVDRPPEGSPLRGGREGSNGGGQRRGRGSFRSGNRGRGGSTRGGHNHSQGGKCPNCGYHSHARGQECPARGKRCSACNKYDHFKAVCRSAQKVDMLNAREEEAQEDTYFLGSIGNVDEEEPPWRVTMTICNTDIDFKIDTGAAVSIIPATMWKKLQPKPKLQESSAKLDSPGGPVPSLGQFIA